MQVRDTTIKGHKNKILVSHVQVSEESAHCMELDVGEELVQRRVRVCLVQVRFEVLRHLQSKGHHIAQRMMANLQLSQFG